jgi:hypothetical protein
MEDSFSSRLSEPNVTPVVRSTRRPPQADNAAAIPGPYETSYEIKHGYLADRTVERP